MNFEAVIEIISYIHESGLRIESNKQLLSLIKNHVQIKRIQERRLSEVDDFDEHELQELMINSIEIIERFLQNEYSNNPVTDLTSDQITPDSYPSKVG